MWIDSLIGQVARHKTHARFESRRRNILFCVEKVMFFIFGAGAPISGQLSSLFYNVNMAMSRRRPVCHSVRQL